MTALRKRTRVPALVVPSAAPVGFVPVPRCDVTAAQLSSWGFTVQVVGKVVGTPVVAVEGLSLPMATELAERAGFVRWATSAEWAAARERRLASSKVRPSFDFEVLAFLRGESSVVA